jgi:DNA-binding transcriptional LysR family regulator
VRLFHRSTRKLTLTETGERFLQEIGGNLEALQAAIAGVSAGGGEPAGVSEGQRGADLRPCAARTDVDAAP